MIFSEQDRWSWCPLAWGWENLLGGSASTAGRLPFPAAAVHHCCWCRTSAWPAHCPSCTSQWTLPLVPRAFWTQTDLGVNKTPSVAVCGFLMADLPPLSPTRFSAALGTFSLSSLRSSGAQCRSSHESWVEGIPAAIIWAVGVPLFSCSLKQLCSPCQLWSL